MPEKYKKALRTLAILAVLALIWQFGIKPRMKRYETWSGVVKEGYSLYGQSTVSGDQHQDPGESRRYYLKIECDDGTVRHEGLPGKVWQRFRVGARVVKESGERFPRIVEAEDPKKPEEAAGDSAAQPETAASNDSSESGE